MLHILQPSYSVLSLNFKYGGRYCMMMMGGYVQEYFYM